MITNLFQASDLLAKTFIKQSTPVAQSTDLSFLFCVPFWLISMILILLSIGFWIWTILDLVKRKFKNENDKIMWVLIVCLSGSIGSIIYFFMVKRYDKK